MPTHGKFPISVSNIYAREAGLVILIIPCIYIYHFDDFTTFILFEFS